MSLRRYGPLALALASLAACKDVEQEPPATQIVIAAFASPIIPTPNDLALQAVPTLPAGAQRDLLQSFVDGGGFPSDQEVTVSIPFRSIVRNEETGAYEPAPAPAIDLATVTASTATVLKVDGPVQAIDLDASYANGVLTLRKRADASGSRRWAPGRYVIAVRGGASGVKTTAATGALPVSPDQAVQLVIPNVDMKVKENQPPGGLPAALVTQLEGLRAALWQPLDWAAVTGPGGFKVWAPRPSATVTAAFPAVETVFPRAEVAAIATFGVAPSTGGVPLVDAGSGQAPLPIDLLRTGPNGTIAENPAFGAAARGLATLDGFSTTAMILAATSVPVDAGTVHGGNVLLYRLDPAGGAPTLLPELKHQLALAQAGAGGNPASARYVAEPSAIVIAQGKDLAPGVPCPVTGGCSPAIGLQPAARAPVPGVGTFFLPPLQEDTSYAVVITRRVKDVRGNGLARPTVMTLLLSASPLVANGQSLVAGVPATTAGALEAMKAELAPVFTGLPAGTTLDDVALAYTFKTQSIAATALSLAAAPFAIEQGAGQAIFTPSAATRLTTLPPGVPTTGVAGFWDVTFKSVDAIDKTTGALRPTLATDLASPATLQPLLGDLHALVAVPDASLVPPCPSPPFPAGALCAKLVVVGHGLNGSKETLFALAASLASRGFVAAAIDFPLHGSRNWCSSSADCVAAGGGDGTCTPFEGGAGQGDATPPGVCTGGSAPRPGGARYFVSSNFFRIRDAFRQNLLDQSALTLALARPPGTPTPPGNPFTAAALPAGLIIDPSTVYYEGVSLGSIAGTSVAATNPRISRAALSVGGGTFVDIAITSPTFVDPSSPSSIAPLFTGLLQGALPAGTEFSFAMVDPASAAFNPAVAQAFLRLANVAKWILDPGDPVNFALHLEAAPLPNLLANPDGSVPQAKKEVFGQLAKNDAVVPNPTNELLYGLIGADSTLYQATGGGSVPHGIIGTSPIVQGDAAQFLLDLTVPATTVTLP